MVSQITDLKPVLLTQHRVAHSRKRIDVALAFYFRSAIFDGDQRTREFCPRISSTPNVFLALPALSTKQQRRLNLSGTGGLPRRRQGPGRALSFWGGGLSEFWEGGGGSGFWQVPGGLTRMWGLLPLVLTDFCPIPLLKWPPVS